MSHDRFVPVAILERLEQVLEERRHKAPEDSYVAALFADGDDAILKKIGEEATELVLAGKDGLADRIIGETADLWFHSLVLLAYKGLGYRDIMQELERRFGTSGIVEKHGRSKPGS